jgi:hypothetical protein
MSDAKDKGIKERVKGVVDLTLGKLTRNEEQGTARPNRNHEWFEQEGPRRLSR